MGTVKMIFGVGLIVLLAIVSFKLIPPYFANYEFEDYIKNEALQSTYGTRSEADIKEAVIKHARDYDIQLSDKQVHVVRTGTSGAGSLSIEANYSVPVNLPGYTTSLEFHPSTQNKGVY